MTLAQACGAHSAACQATCAALLARVRELQLDEVRVAWPDLHGTQRGKTLVCGGDPAGVEGALEDAVGAGVEAIAADCGGSLTCTTCHVVVDADWPHACPCPVPSADERSMLEMTATPCDPGSRLSSQITLTPTLDRLRAPASHPVPKPR